MRWYLPTIFTLFLFGCGKEEATSVDVRSGTTGDPADPEGMYIVLPAIEGESLSIPEQKVKVVELSHQKWKPFQKIAGRDRVLEGRIPKIIPDTRKQSLLARE